MPNAGEEGRLASSTGKRTQLAYARIAGFMFLFVTAVHLAGLAITSQLIVPGDFAATAQHITASEQVYRAGLLLQLIPSCAAVLLAGALYALLVTVDSHLALFALIWRAASAVFGGIAVLFSFAAVKIYTGAAPALSPGEREGLAALLSRGHTVGIDISAVFFSVSSLIYFCLLFRSRFVPRALSLLGILASLLFPLISFAMLIVPDQAATLQLGWAPMLAAETLTGLWLLFIGASLKHWSSRTQEATS